MASVDFKIVTNTSVEGVTIIHSLNEDAFEFLTDELQFGYLPNGDVTMSPEDVSAFICEAEGAHFYSEVV